jgi:hypothetical protein
MTDGRASGEAWSSRGHAGRASLWRDDIGAALVEFSILAPFLLSLGLGMFEFGRFLYQYQLVVEGLRDGTRYLARLDPDDGTNQLNAARLATTGPIDELGAQRVPGWVATDVIFETDEIPNPSGAYRGPDPIQVIRATTTYDYADLGFLDVLGLDALSVSATHEQRVIEE